MGSSVVCCISAMPTKGARRCVWFAGGSAVLAEGLCNIEGDEPAICPVLKLAKTG
jgi:hypothetical protein